MNQTLKINKRDDISAEEALNVTNIVTDIFTKGLEMVFVGHSIVLVYSKERLDKEHIDEMFLKGFEFSNAVADNDDTIRIEFFRKRA